MLESIKQLPKGLQFFYIVMSLGAYILIIYFIIKLFEDSPIYILCYNVIKLVVASLWPFWLPFYLIVILIVDIIVWLIKKESEG